MRRLSLFALAVAVSLPLATLAVAGEVSKAVTLEGKLMCARCELDDKAAAQCQRVLVVEDENDSPSYYYLAKSEAYDKFRQAQGKKHDHKHGEKHGKKHKKGHACQSVKVVKITGMVSEKDGKKWIAPSKMEEKAS